MSSDFLLLNHHKKVGHIAQALFLFFKTELQLCPLLPPPQSPSFLTSPLLLWLSPSLSPHSMPSAALVCTLLKRNLSCSHRRCIQRDHAKSSKQITKPQLADQWGWLSEVSGRNVSEVSLVVGRGVLPWIPLTKEKDWGSYHLTLSLGFSIPGSGETPSLVPESPQQRAKGKGQGAHGTGSPVGEVTSSPLCRTKVCKSWKPIWYPEGILACGHFKSCHYKSSLIERNEVLIHATYTNMDKLYAIKEPRHTKDHILCDATYMRIGKSMEIGSRLALPRLEGVREEENNCFVCRPYTVGSQGWWQNSGAKWR